MNEICKQNDKPNVWFLEEFNFLNWNIKPTVASETSATIYQCTRRNIKKTWIFGNIA
jgi:hypothetical protein